MPRVLFVSDDPNDCRIGAVNAPHRLAEFLRQRGWGCDLLFREDLGPWPKGERMRLALSPLLAWRAVRRHWRRHGPYDVIDASGPDGFVLGALRRVSCYRRARLIVRSHGLERLYFAGLIADHDVGHQPKPWYRRILYPLTRLSQEAGAYRLADAAIVLNRREVATLAARGWQPPEHIHQIPHGVEQRRWREAPAPDAARGAGVLFSGAWHNGKGIRYLAEAHARLLAAGLPMPLTLLAGMEEPAEFAAEERWIRRVFAAGCQPLLTVLPRAFEADEVFAHYRRHDFLVLPSNVEAFGLVVLEAMSQRLPVICSDAVGAAEWLRNGHDALITPARDAAALAGAMARLWCSPELRRRLAEAGHRTAHDLSWARAAEATLAVYA